MVIFTIVHIKRIYIIFKHFVGTSLLVEAIAQHNIQSIERIYENIKIESLARLLGFEPCKAELMVGRMISEGRIEGSINQKTGFIIFKH